MIPFTEQEMFFRQKPPKKLELFGLNFIHMLIFDTINAQVGKEHMPAHAG